jgi:hypothetical protein
MKRDTAGGGRDKVWRENTDRTTHIDLNASATTHFGFYISVASMKELLDDQNYCLLSLLVKQLRILYSA